MLVNVITEDKERTYIYETEDERDAFVDGVEYVNDGSIEITEVGSVNSNHPKYGGMPFLRLYDQDMRDDADPDRPFTVYVVTYETFGQSGGFDWYFTRPDAERAYAQEIKTYQSFKPSVTLVSMFEYATEFDPSLPEMRQLITDQLDGLSEYSKLAASALHQTLIRGENDNG